MTEKTKKILIATGIYGPEIGGPASYSKNIASKLSNATVLTFSSVWSWPDDKKQPYKVVRVWKKIPKGLRHILYFLKAWSLARNSDTVFALNAVSAGLPAMYAAKLAKKKFFVKIVGDAAWERAALKNKTPYLLNDYQSSKRTGWSAILHKLQAKVCKSADGIIVPSKYLAEIVKGWGVSPDKIKVIYNGADFTPANLTKEEARTKIGIHGNIILSAGRMAPWKGFRMLVKIMPKLLELNQFARLVIIGAGPDRRPLEAMIKNMGLDKKVYLVGKKSKNEMAVYFAASDIFVLNSGYEGFSHQILEAMMAGVPVVASAIGGNKEVITQGQNGFLVRYNDEFNIIEAVKTLWANREFLDEISLEGQKTADKFSVKRMLEETVRVLIY